MPIDIEKLEDSPHLLDLLVQMEDVLDSMDVYVFKNWIDGEVVDGPKVRRYWLDMTLKYPYDKMPDPRAGLRLLKHGVRVDFSKAHEDASGKTEVVTEGSDNEGLVWLAHVSIPRRLIVEINAGQLDFYDEEIDAQDVEAAQDAGVTDETGYTAPEDAAGMPPPPPGGAAPPPMPGAPPAQPPVGGPPRA